MRLEKQRVVDPVLTTIAQGYKNGEHIGEGLFPIVPVSKEGGKIPKFGKEAFKIYRTRRAIRTKANRIDYDVDKIDFVLEEEALEGALDDREVEEGMDVTNVRARRTRVVQDAINLKREKQIADQAQNANNYGANNKLTLSGTDQFSDYANSKPIKLVEEAKEQVRRSIGIRPNTLAIGAQVYAVLKEHPALLEKIKYTQRGIVTPDLMAPLFDVKRVLVGEAVYADSNDAMQDIWGNVMILAYVPDSQIAGEDVPSFGYTLRKKGRPIVTRYREEPNMEVLHVSDIYTVKQLSDVAGFLFQNVVDTSE